MQVEGHQVKIIIIRFQFDPFLKLSEGYEFDLKFQNENLFLKPLEKKK